MRAVNRIGPTTRATDIYSPRKRSEIMSHVRAKDTSPEKRVRRIIHRMGFRFRLHDSNLPGKPDIVLPRHKKIIFVNGCFWHRHPGCGRSKLPQTRWEWWLAKLEKNVKRDEENMKRLKSLGWTVCVLWECEVRNEPRAEDLLAKFLNCGKQ